MHLGNMFLAEDAITIFDAAIEFNEDLRWIDVASEVAFCTMDLANFARPRFAHRFLNGWLEDSNGYEALSVFRLYFVYRAIVTEKVLEIQRASGGRFSDGRPAKEIENYVALASATTRPATPFLAITHGVSGSGKTLGSQAVVEATGGIRIRSDVERKRLAGFDTPRSHRFRRRSRNLSPRVHRTHLRQAGQDCLGHPGSRFLGHRRRDVSA